MKTIYAVTSGEYSDWSVHALFESEADAEAHAKKRNEGASSSYDVAGVAEFCFYPEGEQPERLTVYRITAHRSEERGYKETERSDVVWSYDYEGDEAGGSVTPSGSSSDSDSSSRSTASYISPPYSWGKYFNAHAHGTDPARTRKAFQDAMYRAKAEYEGLG